MLDGREYTYDEELPADLDVRLLELLYTQRRVEVIGPKEVLPMAADAQAEPRKKAPAKKVEPEAAAADKPPMKYRVKQAGLGGFKVIGPNGAPVGEGHKTYALAEAEAERLSKLEA
jgi:hypothetical protein